MSKLHEIHADVSQGNANRVTLEIRTLEHGIIKHRTWLDLDVIDAHRFACALHDVINGTIPHGTRVFAPSQSGGHT